MFKAQCLKLPLTPLVIYANLFQIYFFLILPFKIIKNISRKYLPKVFKMQKFDDLLERKKTVAVIGLGYVGLPLALAFAKKFNVVGFDINPKRIKELDNGIDRTNESGKSDLADAKIHFTSDPEDIKTAGVIIIAVPTPIDKNRNPDLTPVISATRIAGRNMAYGAAVVYESTVYPGLTEEICIPVLEEESGKKFGRDFSVGYSPERINPGDKIHRLENIIKIVAGSDEDTLELLAKLYGSIIKAGIHKASSIKVAEAAKVIENTQRDLNIALMNELAIIFEKMEIDTLEVLEAAGSKWNFLPFRPGLVGGHCIGVDPYYLTFKAEEMGFHPEVILAGRRINDRMGKYIAERAIKKLIAAERKVNGCKIGILGFTFKENVPDLRNTKVIDLIKELEDYGARTVVHDPWADADEAMTEYGIKLDPLDNFKDLDALVLAVGHTSYQSLTPEKIKSFFANPEKGILLDVKGFFDINAIKKAGIDFWRL